MQIGALTLRGEGRGEVADEPVVVDRVENGRLTYETRFGAPVDLNNGRAASQLLRFVADPVARTSFRNVFGYALAATAHFDEATKITDDQLQYDGSAKLDFVIPYALMIHALVASGQRSYAASAELLDEADKRALESGDSSAFQLASACPVRMLIAQASFEAALTRADIDLSSATRSVRGELLGVTALALAAQGNVGRSTAMARVAMEASIGVEGGIAAHCALSVGALNQNQQHEALAHATAALESCASHTGMIESFVSAYSGCPELLVCLLQERDQHAPLDLILHQSGR